MVSNGLEGAGAVTSCFALRSCLADINVMLSSELHRVAVSKDMFVQMKNLSR